MLYSFAGLQPLLLVQHHMFKGDTLIVLTGSSNQAVVNDAAIRLDAAAQADRDTMYVPLRFVSQHRSATRL